ncbi:MAG TPA: metal ABC transporter substrate-binding protein [Rhodothermales bacterium]|nr:metal ABC transporter substrate-binding protein [Rhodothermales bacterium]
MQVFHRFLFLVVSVFLLLPQPAKAQKKLDVVTTLPDLASITKLVGGDKVDVFPIATGYQNPHFVDPKPSYITKLARADMFVTVGLDLETGWVPPLLNSARNGKILKGAPGYVDVSVGVPLLQVPTSVSREQGDIHIYGNPHYWLDPVRGKTIAQNIYEALARLEPANEAYFAANLKQFDDQIDAKLVEWEAKMKPYKGTKVIAYHNEWPYFEQRFGLEIIDFLEPKPGIPPTPSQLAKVIREMQQQHVQAIITSPYFKTDNADLVARKVNGKVVILATSVGAFPQIKDYFDLFDYNLDVLTKALQSAGM